MASVSTQTIALERLQPQNDTESSKPATLASPPEDPSTFPPSDPDTIITASLLADSLVPDGGLQSWLVILACSTLTFWFVGTTYSWGILQAALVKRNLSSPATVSFVGSLTCASISFLALVNARVIRRFGARKCAMAGVGLLGVGMGVSGWLTGTVGGLFFSVGGIMGVGAR